MIHRSVIARLAAFVLVIAGSSSTFSFAGPLAPGTHRLFLQFGYKGEVRTVPFTVVEP